MLPAWAVDVTFTVRARTAEEAKAAVVDGLRRADLTDDPLVRWEAVGTPVPEDD